MAKRRKTTAIKGEFHLPEPIIHRIQSFLTGKEAAQTTILSKSWHSAWLTRPNLYFDESEFNPDSSDDDIGFCDVNISSDDSDSSVDSFSDSSDDSYSDSSGDSDSDSSDDEFLNFAKTTVQRYEQSNLKIETLRLSMRSSFSCSKTARDLIVRALRIGATHISFQLGYEFVLPLEVFESGNFVELSVEGGKIDLKKDQKLICPKLESLSLSKTKIKSEMISKIISSCPLIKKLSLSRTQGFDYRIVCLINLPKPLELMRCLVLCNVKFDISFLADLSSKFPSLEDLTLDSCYNVREICSCSLMRLTLITQGDMKVKFDVPRIQKFTFEGPDFTSMSFTTSSREWESHVSVNYKKPLSTLWFSGLKRILTELRGSKIHLSLSLDSNKSLNYKPEDIHGLSICQVENVTMDLFKLPSSSCCALFAGLFRLCRPKFITHKLYLENTNTCEITNYNFLCKTLVRGMNGRFSSPSNFMHSLHGLENVNMELYDEDVAAWRLEPLESLLDGSTSPKEKQNVRFQLKWKP